MTITLIRYAPYILEMYDRGLSMMRIAATFDLRMREVREVLDSRVPPDQWGKKLKADMMRKSAAHNAQAKGKPRPVGETQASYLARHGRAAVTLPRVSILEGE